MEGVINLFLFFLVYLPIYFLPGIIASRRKLPNAKTIFFINLFLGLTVFGWFAAFILASSGKKQWIASLVSVLIIIVLLTMMSMPRLLAQRRAANELSQSSF